jgi:hypothetical protein
LVGWWEENMKKMVIGEDILMVDVIAICCPRKEAQKYIESLGLEQELEGVGYSAEIPDCKGFVVWLQDPKDFYCLLHECVHLVNQIFASKGMNTNLSNEDETFAYFMSFWFRKLWRFFGNIKKGRK